MTNQNQHWIPTLLLKKFSDTDGRVFRLDIHTGKVSKPPPRKTASSPGFNNFEIDGQTTSFEDRLEKIETAAARALSEIIDARSLVGLQPKQRRRIADFIAAQSIRTEAFYKGLEVRPSRQDFGQIFDQLWKGLFILSARIEHRHWALMIIEGEEVFYLGDQPVVLQRTHAPKDGSNLGFDVDGVEGFMPISPKCALYIPSRDVSDEIVSRYDQALALHRAVRSAALRGRAGGATELMTAQDIIIRSNDLYRAFTMGSPIGALPPYVENLNYLQCSWAYSGIYCNRRDFAFASKVFQENPQYRNTPTVRLLNRTMLIPNSDI